MAWKTWRPISHGISAATGLYLLGRFKDSSDSSEWISRMRSHAVRAVLKAISPFQVHSSPEGSAVESCTWLVASNGHQRWPAQPYWSTHSLRSACLPHRRPLSVDHILSWGKKEGVSTGGRGPNSLWWWLSFGLICFFKTGLLFMDFLSNSNIDICCHHMTVQPISFSSRCHRMHLGWYPPWPVSH